MDYRHLVGVVYRRIDKIIISVPDTTADSKLKAVLGAETDTPPGGASIVGVVVKYRRLSSQVLWASLVSLSPEVMRMLNIYTLPHFHIIFKCSIPIRERI